MARNAAFMAALTLVAVVVSGFVGVTTVPLIAGALPPQRPNPADPAPPGAGAPPQFGVGLARTAFPLMVVLGAVGVLVTPAVDAIPNGAAGPKFTGEEPMPRADPPPRPRTGSCWPHPAAKALSSNAMDHISGLVTLWDLFICFPSLSNPEKHRCNRPTLAGLNPTVLIPPLSTKLCSLAYITQLLLFCALAHIRHRRTLRRHRKYSLQLRRRQRDVRPPLLPDALYACGHWA
jgi:hypothetical protein